MSTENGDGDVWDEDDSPEDIIQGLLKQYHKKKNTSQNPTMEQDVNKTLAKMREVTRDDNEIAEDWQKLGSAILSDDEISKDLRDETIDSIDEFVTKTLGKDFKTQRPEKVVATEVTESIGQKAKKLGAGLSFSEQIKAMAGKERVSEKEVESAPIELKTQDIAENNPKEEDIAQQEPSGKPDAAFLEVAQALLDYDIDGIEKEHLDEYKKNLKATLDELSSFEDLSEISAQIGKGKNPVTWKGLAESSNHKIQTTLSSEPTEEQKEIYGSHVKAKYIAQFFNEEDYIKLQEEGLSDFRDILKNYNKHPVSNAATALYNAWQDNESQIESAFPELFKSDVVQAEKEVAPAPSEPENAHVLEAEQKQAKKKTPPPVAPKPTKEQLAKIKQAKAKNTKTLASEPKELSSKPSKGVVQSRIQEFENIIKASSGGGSGVKSVKAKEGANPSKGSKEGKSPSDVVAGSSIGKGDSKGSALAGDSSSKDSQPKKLIETREFNFGELKAHFASEERKAATPTKKNKIEGASGVSVKDLVAAIGKPGLGEASDRSNAVTAIIASNAIDGQLNPSPHTPSVPTEFNPKDANLKKFLQQVENYPEVQSEKLTTEYKKVFRSAECMSNNATFVAKAMQPLETAKYQTNKGEDGWRKTYNVDVQREGPLYMPRKTREGRTVKNKSGEVVYDILFYDKKASGFELNLDKSFIAPDDVPKGSFASITKDIREKVSMYHEKRFEKELGLNKPNDIKHSVADMSLEAAREAVSKHVLRGTPPKRAKPTAKEIQSQAAEFTAPPPPPPTPGSDKEVKKVLEAGLKKQQPKSKSLAEQLKAAANKRVSRLD